MSDLMLFAVLEMPFNMAMADELSRAQYWQRGQEAATKLRDLATQVESLQADAERYRWLRFADLDELAKNNWIAGEVYTGKDLDAAIDEARKQS